MMFSLKSSLSVLVFLLAFAAQADESKTLSCKISQFPADTFSMEEMANAKVRGHASGINMFTAAFALDEQNKDGITSAKIEKEMMIEEIKISFYAHSLFLKDAPQGSLGVALKEIKTGYAVQSFGKISADLTKNKNELVFTLPVKTKGPDRLLQITAVCEIK